MTIKKTREGTVFCGDEVCPWRLVECGSPINCKDFEDGRAIAIRHGTCQLMIYRCNRLVRFNRTDPYERR